jgi:hypothetical protein
MCKAPEIWGFFDSRWMRGDQALAESTGDSSNLLGEIFDELADWNQQLKALNKPAADLEGPSL